MSAPGLALLGAGLAWSVIHMGYYIVCRRYGWALAHLSLVALFLFGIIVIVQEAKP